METSLDDSFQSSSGALKDEIISNVVAINEELTIVKMPPETTTVTFAEITRPESESGDLCGKTPPSSKCPTPPTETVLLPDVVGWVTKTETSAANYVATKPPSSSELDEKIASLQRQLSESLMVAENDAKMAAEDEFVEAENDAEDFAEAPRSSVECPPMSMAVLAANKTSPQQRSGRRRCLRSIALVFFASLALLVVLMGLVLETRLDFPVVTDLRGLPEVQQFATETYFPVRQAVIDQVNGLLGYYQ
jgi:hypothetical protein